MLYINVNIILYIVSIPTCFDESASSSGGLELSTLLKLQNSLS